MEEGPGMGGGGQFPQLYRKAGSPQAKARNTACAEHPFQYHLLPSPVPSPGKILLPCSLSLLFFSFFFSLSFAHLQGFPVQIEPSRPWNGNRSFPTAPARDVTRDARTRHLIRSPSVNGLQIKPRSEIQDLFHQAPRRSPVHGWSKLYWRTT